MTTRDTTGHGHAEPVTVLAFDTSTASLSVAVVRDGTVVGSMQSFAERNHSVQLMPEIQRLMSNFGLKAGGIDAIAVGQGPGSYTGVRIAVTAGKTLAWTWKKMLLGVSSLEALALGVWEKEKSGGHELPAGIVWIVPVMDARRGQVFTSRMRADAEGDWERLDSDGIRLASEWTASLRNEAEHTHGLAGIWFVGETAVHEEGIRNGMGENMPVRILPFAMDAGAVGILAGRRLSRGEMDDIHPFAPNYTQLAEAEAKLLAAARRD